MKRSRFIASGLADSLLRTRILTCSIDAGEQLEESGKDEPDHGPKNERREQRHRQQHHDEAARNDRSQRSLELANVVWMDLSRPYGTSDEKSNRCAKEQRFPRVPGVKPDLEQENADKNPRKLQNARPSRQDSGPDLGEPLDGLAFALQLFRCLTEPPLTIPEP